MNHQLRPAIFFLLLLPNITELSSSIALQLLKPKSDRPIADASAQRTWLSLTSFFFFSYQLVLFSQSRAPIPLQICSCLGFISLTGHPPLGIINYSYGLPQPFPTMTVVGIPCLDSFHGSLSTPSPLVGFSICIVLPGG